MLTRLAAPAESLMRMRMRMRMAMLCYALAALPYAPTPIRTLEEQSLATSGASCRPSRALHSLQLAW